jgi:hypothetical protein
MEELERLLRVLTVTELRGLGLINFNFGDLILFLIIEGENGSNMDPA